MRIRAFQPTDAEPLRSRFDDEARPPWLQLPPPYTLEELLAPSSPMTRFVAESARGQVVALLAIDRRGDFPLIVGPLVSDEQLAELIGHALLKYALDWAAAQGLAALVLKADVREERAVGFLINQGFRVLDWREYFLEARPDDEPPPAPPEGVSFRPCPEMVSSDYAKLYQAVGEAGPWQDRSDWDRQTILQHLQKPELLFFAARAEGRYVGVLELAKTSDTRAEVRHCALVEEASDLLGPFVQHMLRHAWNHWDLERVTLRLLSREVPAAVQVFHLNGFSRRRSLLLLEKPLEHLIGHLRGGNEP